MPTMDREYCLAECKRLRDAILEHKMKTVGVLTAVVVALISSIILLGSSGPKDGRGTCENVETPNYNVPDTCPWQMVMSDVTHRVRLLEMAFKEQAKARELLSLELYNQTDTSEALQRKLEQFLSSLKAISSRIDRTNDRIDQLSSRLYSDECLGFLILLCLVVQILLVLRAKFMEYKMSTLGAQRPAPLAVHKNCPSKDSPTSLTNNNSGSPTTAEKKNNPKMDSCFVLFNQFKPNQQQIAPLFSACSKNCEEGKLSMKSAFVINSEESIQRCPAAKLYVVAISSNFGNSSRIRNADGKESRASHPSSASRSPSQHQGHQKLQQQNSSDVDLLNAFIRFTKSNGGRVFGGNNVVYGPMIGIEPERMDSKGWNWSQNKNAHIFMVVVNDDSSMKLSSNSLYSTSQPLIQGNELLLELAFNGRVCTIWQEFSTFQLNHAKKVYKSLVNMNPK